MSKKRNKYAVGSRVEDPNKALARNNLAWQKAIATGGESSLTTGLDIFGGLAQMVGSSMMQAGAGSNGGPNSTEAPTGVAATGVGKFGTKYGGDILNGLNMLQMFAYGGEVVPVNVEGDEVAQLPNGKMLDFVGPSHEQGGIDVDLPEGTDIYSDRISFDGVTMAERKRLRAKRANKVSKEKDTTSKNTRKRTEQTNAKQEAKDNEIQKRVKESIEADNVEQFAFGGAVDGAMAGIKKSRQQTSIGGNPSGIVAPNQSITTANIPNYVPGENEGGAGAGLDIKNLLGNFTFGDVLGMAGNMYQAKKPMDITKESRATDTPNINAFEDYGRKGLEKVDQAKGKLRVSAEKQKSDITKQQVTASKANRNTARGINQMRALDIATNQGAMEASDNVEVNYANQLISLLLQEAGMLNQQDQVVMQGEQNRDLADRQDKDAFYTQLAQDAVAYGKGLSKTGGSLNEAKTRDTTGEAMNSMFDHVNIDSNTGKISTKANASSAVGKDSSEQLATFAKNKSYEQFGFTKKEWDSLTKQQQMLYLIQ